MIVKKRRRWEGEERRGDGTPLRNGGRGVEGRR